jgi:hypothetical protein
MMLGVQPPMVCAAKAFERSPVDHCSVLLAAGVTAGRRFVWRRDSGERGVQK